MSATRRDWAFLLCLGMIWGAAFMATTVAAREFTPLTIAGVRLALGAAMLLGVMRATGRRLPGFATAEQRGFWLAAAAVAFLANAMPFTSLAWAQRHIPSGLAGVLMATVPLFVLPLAHVFVPGDRITPRKVAGFGLGFCGVLVLIGPAAFAAPDPAGSDSPVALAIGACLLTALGYASGSIVSKRAPQLGLLPFAAAALMIAAIMVLPLAFLLEDPLAAEASPEGLAALVYLGIAPTALATVMLLQVIRSAGPGFLSNVNYQVPIWAVLFGWAVLGETPSPRLAVAAVLILAGLGLAQNLIGLRRGAVPRG
ncbi:EamA family transporter [Paralimibaculum aggregatum]|uniref:EamA family transporter n=1 Tax=Paralimibaculum aggregatum TaxID=3036245 RepID=A0ABQ6LRW6_9RHOB|nr:DMT family transporter [Limibaculum sp. NKW23]GMG84698.1 EamA family transporter [Limibaculum sp. NKW23]